MFFFFKSVPYLFPDALFAMPKSIDIYKYIPCVIYTRTVHWVRRLFTISQTVCVCVRVWVGVASLACSRDCVCDRRVQRLVAPPPPKHGECFSPPAQSVSQSSQSAKPSQFSSIETVQSCRRVDESTHTHTHTPKHPNTQTPHTLRHIDIYIASTSQPVSVRHCW